MRDKLFTVLTTSPLHPKISDTNTDKQSVCSS